MPAANYRRRGLKTALPVIGQVDADVWRLIGCGRDEGFEEQVRGTLGNIPDGL
jgi:hypothetical protein